MTLVDLGSISSAELEILGFAIVFVLWPAWCAVKIARRAGFNAGVGSFSLVVVFSIVAFWWFAFARWPSEEVEGRLDT